MADSKLMEAAFKDAEVSQEVKEFIAGDPHQESVTLDTGDETVTERSDVITSTARGKPLWNRETGVMSMVLTDQAKLRLSQIFPQDHPNPEFRGQRVYTMTPMQEVNPGQLKCKLHPEHPDREFMDKWFKGQVCMKHNMRTPLDVDRHFQSKHRGEAKIVEDFERKEHDAAMLEMQRLQMVSMEKLAGGNSVSPEQAETQIPCPDAECGYEGTPQQVRGHIMGAHKNKKEEVPAS